MVNRKLIEKTVKEEKGLSFTDVKERTGLSNGVLQYHIRQSDRICRKKGAVLYEGACEDCRFSDRCRERCIHKELKKPELRKIVSGMDKGKSQAELADELGLARSTVNYHVDKLREMKLI